MYCCAESEFNVMYKQIIQKYKGKKGVCEYIEGGWCGINCVWRNLRPKFGRFLLYGYVDTTNIIERHWQFIKYTALRGRINRESLTYYMS